MRSRKRAHFLRLLHYVYRKTVAVRYLFQLSVVWIVFVGGEGVISRLCTFCISKRIVRQGVGRAVGGYCG